VDFLWQDFSHAPFWLAALKIIFVNVILSGDNAVVIAMACLTLPPKQRLTLELRIYDDLPFKEIAEILEISEGAAKVNFHYAVRKLKHLLGPSTVGSNAVAFEPVEHGEDHDDPR